MWEINKDGVNEFHPTQKPIALPSKAIKNHKAETVLDLFGGTGTLLVYFHIEIDGKTYVVKANTQLTVPNTKEYIDSLKDISGVNEVWTE